MIYYIDIYRAVEAVKFLNPKPSSTGSTMMPAVKTICKYDILIFLRINACLFCLVFKRIGLSTVRTKYLICSHANILIVLTVSTVLTLLTVYWQC